MKTLFCLFIYLIALASQAQQSPGQTPAPKETQNRIGTTTEDQEISTVPPQGHETQQEYNPETLKRFVPKERIPADSAISFPTDI